jgi:hypothetical protein
MELITRKRPIEPEFGENKDIVYWTSQKIYEKENAFVVLDLNISKSFMEDDLGASCLENLIHLTIPRGSSFY